MQSADKVILNQLLPKNVLVGGLSLQTLSLPLQSGLPMALRWVLEMMMTFYAKVSALVLMGVCSLLWKFYVDKKILIFFPLLCGYFYFFWIIPARHVLLRGLEQVGCLIRCSLLNFFFQLRASGFFCWILTAILHFIVFWALTWSNVVRWCKELQNVIIYTKQNLQTKF